MSNLAKDNVVIRNIYYMMAYAFKTLELKEYSGLSSETFDHFEDLMAAILVMGISNQRKRGFERDYLAYDDDLSLVKGRVNPLQTGKNIARGQIAASCTFDDYTEDTYKNRILKKTAELLVASKSVSEENKRNLKKCLLFLRDVKILASTRIDWKRLKYHRNNGGYQMLMNVCYMVLNGMIISPDSSEMKLANFYSGRELNALYERFILEYFRKHHPDLNATARILDNCVDGYAPPFLPQLCTDITLESKAKILVIDAKCYGRILNMHHEKKILSPANRHQIVDYVVHAAYESVKPVSGMLLYALTESEDAMHESWFEIGHEFHCFTLDLGVEFDSIAKSLDEIAAMAR